MAEANRVRIAYRPEGSTNWKTLRRTGDSLTAGTETARSGEIRSDRKRGDQKITTITASGSVNFEFSATSFDDFLAAAMCQAWSVDTPAIGTDQLTVGTETTKFEILKSYLDENRHVLIKGAEVESLSLTMNAGEKVTGELSFLGTEVDTEYDPTADTFDPADSTMFMDSSNNLSSIMIDGQAADGMCFTGMSLELTNNHQSQGCIGSQFQRHTKGSSDITGSKTIRMSGQAFDLWRNSINNVPISTSFTMGDGTTSYTFSAGREFLSGDLPSGELDSILSMELSSTLATDSTGETLVIERTAA